MDILLISHPKAIAISLTMWVVLHSYFLYIETCCCGDVTDCPLHEQSEIQLCLDLYTFQSTQAVLNIVTYSGVLFTMELYCTPKSQYTTVKHSQQLFEHT
jgi:hypothetical protein